MSLLEFDNYFLSMHLDVTETINAGALGMMAGLSSSCRAEQQTLLQGLFWGAVSRLSRKVDIILHSSVFNLLGDFPILFFPQSDHQFGFKNMYRLFDKRYSIQSILAECSRIWQLKLPQKSSDVDLFIVEKRHVL